MFSAGLSLSALSAVPPPPPSAMTAKSAMSPAAAGTFSVRQGQIRPVLIIAENKAPVRFTVVVVGGHKSGKNGKDGKMQTERREEGRKKKEKSSVLVNGINAAVATIRSIGRV